VELLVKFYLPVGLALAALVAMPVQAKEGDTFRPFVSMGYFYDSNLYRLVEAEFNLAPSDLRDDRYSILSAGINVDWKPGRQQIVANATKTWIRYDQNSRLDFDGDDTQATWNWRLGNRLSGNLGAAKSTSQSSFEDVGVVNNQVDRERYYGRAEWEFHPRWRIGGGVEEIDNTNSALTQRSQDFQQQAYDGVLSYRTPKGGNLRLQVRRIDADFPNPQVLASVCSFFVFCPPYPFIPSEVTDNSYKQTEYNLLGDWRVSGKLTLRGQAGWVDRQYESVLKGNFNGFSPVLVPRPDFSGFVGRVSGDWYATGKTLLSASLYREPGGAGDINASSVLKNGASVNGVWLVREKWRMNAKVTYENRDFKGDPGTLQEQRNDDTVGASLSLSYMPIQAVSVDVGVSSGRRDSNFSVEEYEFHSVFANVRADF
jgi:exopolysaccharide biosynthesis operon protein EpsL